MVLDKFEPKTCATKQHRLNCIMSIDKSRDAKSSYEATTLPELLKACAEG